MKIAVTGINGNIGKVLIQRGATPLDVDVIKFDDVRRAIEKASPDIIIHTASKSKPDWCEEHPEEAISVNFTGSKTVFHLASKFHIPVVALSTDHVFTGKVKFVRLPYWGYGITRGGPYSEDYRKTYPVNYYGLTKLAMETLCNAFDNVKVVRTSNCFWESDPRVLWYLKKLYEDDVVPVPTFQKRSFMHRQHFVENLEWYCENFDKMPDILHISGTETINWYDFAIAFASTLNISKALIRKFTKKRFDDKRKAQRPKRAGLKVELSKALGMPQYSYKDGLEFLK